MEAIVGDDSKLKAQKRLPIFQQMTSEQVIVRKATAVDFDYETPVKYPSQKINSPILSFQPGSSVKTDFLSQMSSNLEDFTEDEDQNFSIFLNELCYTNSTAKTTP